MKSKQEIEKKAMELYKVRLELQQQKYLSRTHMNCVYNQRHKVKESGNVGFCTNCKLVNESNPVKVCNDTDTAEKCPLFVSAHTVESVKRDFDDIVRSPARCGKDEPKLAMLLWVLQEEENNSKNNDGVKKFDKINKNCGIVLSRINNFSRRLSSASKEIWKRIKLVLFRCKVSSKRQESIPKED